MSFRGAFHPGADDLPARSEARTIVLIGLTGRKNWPTFAASAEAADGKSDPLDRWSLRVISAIAARLGATAIFPFAGPPWLPFQRWAQKTEPVYPSPLGMLIHPDWGLWHAWRGALACLERLELPEPDARANPCESCAGKPCLTACPVNAFTPSGYDVAACVAHIDTSQGADCMEQGCCARRACPVGAAHRYGADQAEFHMRAFRAAQR
jgi:ferredoxin